MYGKRNNGKIKTKNMIQANELRIGNWVDHFGNFGQVETIKKDGVIFLVYGKLKQGDFGNVIEALEPIPLTDEILEKCGFEKVGNEWVVKIEYTECFEMKYDVLYYTSGEGICMGVGCKYLHELQNLVFGLFRKELTYNP